MLKKELSHINKNGNAQMVDIGEKEDQYRVAIATGKIILQPETLDLIRSNQIKKGDVLSVARIAGIQAAKQTSVLIPLCHNILLTKIEINIDLISNGAIVTTLVKSFGKTGVELEALNGVSVALLTIYDMCKAVDKNMEMVYIRLIEKRKSNNENSDNNS